MILALVIATLFTSTPSRAAEPFQLICTLEGNVPGVQSVEFDSDGTSGNLTMIENIHGTEKVFVLSKQEFDSKKIRLHTDDGSGSALLSLEGRDAWVTYRSPGFNISGPAFCDYK